MRTVLHRRVAYTHMQQLFTTYPFFTAVGTAQQAHTVHAHSIADAHQNVSTRAAVYQTLQLPQTFESQKQKSHTVYMMNDT